jgi:hypothetical protein
MVDRDLKNVQEDIRILEPHGLVKITKRPRGTRKVKVLEVPFEENSTPNRHLNTPSGPTPRINIAGRALDSLVRMALGSREPRGTVTMEE